MEIIVFIALVVSTIATLRGSLSRTTRQTIQFLALQAAAIGSVELMYCLINLVLGLHVEALVKFFAVFAEWFSCAVVTPLIIYWGMVRTEDVADQPMMGRTKVVIFYSALIASHAILGVMLRSVFPPQLEALFFVSIMFFFSIFLMATRMDPLKILVGLNMAENALYPLLAKSPLNVIPFMLILMIFVNVVGVFVITEAYRDYGTLKVSDWRWRD